jgi:hypothetical protein
VCGRTQRFDKNRGAIFGRRSLAAAVRSEAEDERPSPAASNPTLSATENKQAPTGPFYFQQVQGVWTTKFAGANLDARSAPAQFICPDGATHDFTGLNHAM